jgi:hypothetical protein
MYGILATVDAAREPLVEMGVAREDGIRPEAGGLSGSVDVLGQAGGAPCFESVDAGG